MTLMWISVFLVAALASWLLTPLVIRLANLVGALDQPDERKIHSHPTPRLGGVGIFVAFALTLACTLFIFPDFDFSFWSQHSTALIVAFPLILALGIWDDIKSLKAGPKFLAQLLIATIVYANGFRLSAIANPIHGGMLDLGWFDYPATVLWIIGITNALNLTDGLDGLASGVTLFASLTVFAVSLVYQDTQTALLALIIAGAVLGFLRYNFHPAKIFLGDSGSLVLGFALAILTLHIPTKRNTLFALIVPVLVLGLPILDTFLSMARRFLRPFLPNRPRVLSTLEVFKSIFLPDRQHIHHQLMAKGLSHPRVVLLLYLVSASLGLGAFLLSAADNILGVFITLLIAIGTVQGIRMLGYREVAVHRNGILMHLYMNVIDWPLLLNPWFRALVDASFIAVSYAVASTISGAPILIKGTEPYSLLVTLAVIGGVQHGMFLLTGMYKQVRHQLGIGDALRTTWCVLVTGAVSSMLFAVVSSSPKGTILVTMLLDIYFLLTLVLATRFAYAMLLYLLEREDKGKKRVLIYGANSEGLAMLRLLLDSDDLKFAPVGFLDEDPSLEGKRLDGYTVYGGHWKLHEVLRKGKVEEILIASNNVEKEILRRMKSVAQRYNVPLRTVGVQVAETHSVPMPEKIVVESSKLRNS